VRVSSDLFVQLIETQPNSDFGAQTYVQVIRRQLPIRNPARQDNWKKDDRVKKYFMMKPLISLITVFDEKKKSIRHVFEYCKQ